MAHAKTIKCDIITNTGNALKDSRKAALMGNLVDEELKRDTSFLSKCAYHAEMMDLYNQTGKSPMELADSSAGQTILDEINSKVSRAMAERFGS